MKPNFSLKQLRAQAVLRDQKLLDLHSRNKHLPLALKLRNATQALLLAHSTALNLDHYATSLLSLPLSDSDKPHAETLRIALQRLRKTLRELRT